MLAAKMTLVQTPRHRKLRKQFNARLNPCSCQGARFHRLGGFEKRDRTAMVYTVLFVQDKSRPVFEKFSQVHCCVKSDDVPSTGKTAMTPNMSALYPVAAVEFIRRYDTATLWIVLNLHDWWPLDDIYTARRLSMALYNKLTLINLYYEFCSRLCVIV